MMQYKTSDNAVSAVYVIKVGGVIYYNLHFYL